MSAIPITGVINPQLRNMPDLSSVQAVIVLYKSTLEHSSTFQSLNDSLQQLKPGRKFSLLVYDNSPERQEILYDNFKHWEIIYKHDRENAGVSKAYNVGAEYARRADKKWLLILDQDTIFPLNAMEEYLRALSLDQYFEQKLFCPILISANTVISPCKLRFYRGHALKTIPLPGIFDLNMLMPINSGLLINIDVFERAGGYNNRIKLDFSDFEFIERFRNINNKAVLLSIHCQHGLSSHNVIDLNTALTRFNYYISGARQLKKGSASLIKIESLLLLRAVKLSFRFQSPRFLSSLLQ